MKRRNVLLLTPSVRHSLYLCTGMTEAQVQAFAVLPPAHINAEDFCREDVERARRVALCWSGDGYDANGAPV